MLVFKHIINLLNLLELQTFKLFAKMSSFTPLYNPAISLFQTGFYPWISVDSWNSSSFMLFPMKKVEVSDQKTSSSSFQAKAMTSTTLISPLEEEYEPQKQIEGFQTQQRKSGGRIQCRGRNDYSNILKAFIHLIKTNGVLKEKIKSIIALKQLSLTYERFLMRIRRKFSKGKTYISPKQILTFLKTCNQTNDQSERAIGLLFRIILKNFLSLQYVLCLIKSFKGKKQSRKQLILKTRQLCKIIFQEGLDYQSS